MGCSWILKILLLKELKFLRCGIRFISTYTVAINNVLLQHKSALELALASGRPLLSGFENASSHVLPIGRFVPTGSIGFV